MAVLFLSHLSRFVFVIYNFFESSPMIQQRSDNIKKERKQFSLCFSFMRWNFECLMAHNNAKEIWIIFHAIFSFCNNQKLFKLASFNWRKKTLIGSLMVIWQLVAVDFYFFVVSRTVEAVKFCNFYISFNSNRNHYCRPIVLKGELEQVLSFVHAMFSEWPYVLLFFVDLHKK